MMSIRASKAQIDLEMRNLNLKRDIIERLFIDENLPRSTVAERVGVKDSRLRSWMEIHGMFDPEQARKARLERLKRGSATR